MWGEIERRAAPRSREELRALLDLDVPIVLTGMGEGLPAMQLWTVEHLVAKTGDVRWPVVRTDPAKHVPGAGDTAELTLSDLVPILAAQQQGGVRHYLAGPNMFAHEQQLTQLLAECEDFYQSTVVRTKIGCLGMWLGKNGQRTWLHFDCANNFLLQIKGSKTLTLAPPSAYPSLYCYTYASCRGQDMDGEMYRFSEVNAWHPDLVVHPRAAKVPFSRVTISAGETLLLPLGWFHAVESHGDPDYNVALNLFFDAEPSDWAKVRERDGIASIVAMSNLTLVQHKYLKSFRRQYS